MQHESLRKSLQSYRCRSPFLVYPLCFLSTCACFAVTYCPPFPSFIPWTNNPMSDGFLYTMPHCIFTSFPNTFGGEKSQAMSRRFLKSTFPRAGNTPLWTVLFESSRVVWTGNLRAALSWCRWHIYSEEWLWSDEFMTCMQSGLQWPLQVNIFFFQAFASLLQLRGQLPLCILLHRSAQAIQLQPLKMHTLQTITTAWPTQ